MHHPGPSRSVHLAIRAALVAVALIAFWLVMQAGCTGGDCSAIGWMVVVAFFVGVPYVIFCLLSAFGFWIIDSINRRKRKPAVQPK
jgi:hypothetical protein